MVLDAFVRALSFFGGVPRRVIIDNPTTMVTYVSRSKNRIFYPRFLALMNHYVIEPVACTPASHCNRRTVAAINVQGGDWCLALKGNQDSLLSDAWTCFGQVKGDHPVTRLEETGHGRKETRSAVVVSARGLAEHHDFPGLKACGRIEATREVDGASTSQTRVFALSWTPTPEVLLATVRAHWAFENALQWQLDVSFREDAARNRKDNAPGIRGKNNMSKQGFAEYVSFLYDLRAPLGERHSAAVAAAAARFGGHAGQPR